MRPILPRRDIITSSAKLTESEWERVTVIRVGIYFGQVFV